MVGLSLYTLGFVGVRSKKRRPTGADYKKSARAGSRLQPGQGPEVIMFSYVTFYLGMFLEKQAKPVKLRLVRFSQKNVTFPQINQALCQLWVLSHN